MKIHREIEIISNSKLLWQIISNVNEYSRWNPHIKHAVNYGRFEKDSKFKLISGAWEFNLIIVEAIPEHGVFIVGKTSGINIDLKLKLDGSKQNSTVIVDIELAGWMTVLSKKKIEKASVEFIDLFLSSVKMRAELGEVVQDKIKDDKVEEPATDSFHMPTPFNVIYKSGTRSKRKRLN